MKLPDAIKWRAHNLFSVYTSTAIQIIWQTYQTLRITIALLEWKKKHLDVFWVKDKAQHRELRAFSSRISCGFFNVPQSWDSILLNLKWSSGRDTEPRPPAREACPEPLSHR